MATTDVVKSTFMVDPDDKFNLIRRTESGADLDREYWERVNQGDNVSNVAKMFESSKQESEQFQREQIKVGRLKRDSFLENFVKNEENYKDQMKTGKLNVEEIFPINKSEEIYRAEIKVGKLRKKELFNNKENEDSELVKPRMKIGKLDTNNMFDSSNKERENEKEMFNNIAIGKLEKKNIFENCEREDVEKPSIKVGKIKAKELFSENTEPSSPKASINVGKLKIKEEDLFENKDDISKPVIAVGKINAKEIFNNSPTEEKNEMKFYKPTVQPKKIKVQNLFQETEESSEKQEVKIGKINSGAFLQITSENNDVPKQTLRVGKLDTSKLFDSNSKEDEEVGESRNKVVGKINVGQVFQQSDEKETEIKREVQVGRLPQNIYTTNDSKLESDEVTEEIPKLRGARKVKKGNRISCLIENLHTDKKNDSDEEKEDEEKEVEEIKLGRDRMSAIQNMFSGQESECDSKQIKNQVSVSSSQISGLKERYIEKLENSESSTALADFEELKGEGLVSSNLERFTSGNILGGQNSIRKSSLETNYLDKKHIESVSAKFEEAANRSAQADQNAINHVPRKLRNSENLFHHNKENYTDCVKVEVKVGKIDANNIFKPATNEAETTKDVTLKVGKIKNAEEMFNKQSSEDQNTRSGAHIGKLDTKNIFESTNEEKEVSRRSSLTVGKLSKDVFNPSTEKTDDPKVDTKVGKISTKDLFKKVEENSEELLSIVKVGKLSEDKLILASNAGEDQDAKRDLDTDIVPSGKVSERANAFLTSKEPEQRPARVQAPTVKRSESSLAADMQKKYQEQMQSGSLKRKESQKITEKSESTQETVQAGKMKDARNSFFQSMMTCSSNSSSAQRLGTSIMPAGSCENWKLLDSSSMESRNEVKTTSSKKGKALFQRCAEKQEAEEAKCTVETTQVLPGVDLEEIEDEFERLHREMMGDS